MYKFTDHETLDNLQEIGFLLSTTLGCFVIMNLWFYVEQDYIDSMEGATLSGRQASAYICDAGEELVALRKKLAAAESPENTVSCPVTDEPSLV